MKTTRERRSAGRGARAGGERAVSAALESMRRILQEVRVANRGVEQQLGLSGAQLFVLEELEREPAGSLNELAARTATRHSSVSTVVARLVELGLVSRQVDRQDARRVQLTVTARARRLLRDAPPSAQARLLAAARTLPPAQLTQLADGLEAWGTRFTASQRPEAATAGRRAAAGARR
jgi:DNA-binding MarR family transcriptional regulator